MEVPVVVDVSGALVVDVQEQCCKCGCFCCCGCFRSSCVWKSLLLWKFQEQLL